MVRSVLVDSNSFLTPSRAASRSQLFARFPIVPNYSSTLHYKSHAHQKVTHSFGGVRSKKDLMPQTAMVVVGRV